eukprot:8817892-Pyramimonas_sp.AAC.1
MAPGCHAFHNSLTTRSTDIRGAYHTGQYSGPITVHCTPIRSSAPTVRRRNVSYITATAPGQ